MSDITMCRDNECNRKDTCYRYTAKVGQYRQVYFTDSPRLRKLGGSDCSYYWDNRDKKEEIEKMLNENAVYDVMLEAVLNGRYTTDEEAEEWVDERVDEVVEAAEEYLDTLIGTLLANG